MQTGIEHILLGVDHLLFVLGLIWIVRSRWMLIKTITAFTVAHSLTLAAATFGLVGVPERPVNALIALSIVFMGVEIVKLRHGQVGLTARHPWIVAFAFGLLPGFGFATALTILGLPPGDLPLALLAFNVGVEIGQIAFVSLVLALIWAFRELQLALVALERVDLGLCHRRPRRFLVHRPDPSHHHGLRNGDHERQSASPSAHHGPCLDPDCRTRHRLGPRADRSRRRVRERLPASGPRPGPRDRDGRGRPLGGAQLGAPAVWMLPINFPLIMAAGGMLGALGVPLPFVEIGIAVSGIALGVLVALATRAPLWAAMLLVGVFAVFHGHAHGTELPEAANPLAYGAGFVLMTGLLHLSGIAFGLLYERPLGARAVRVCGGLIAVSGGYFLASALGLAA